jgi:hypothetical protein
MNRRTCLLGLCCLVLSGCGAAVGAGNGGVDNLATTRIRTDSPDAIRRAVIDVFKADEFTVLSQTSDSVTFSKRGGRTAEIAWTTIGNPNPVMIRPTVRWRQTGPSQFTVNCRVEIVQQSTVRGEIIRQPMMMGSSAYNRMLRQVRRQVEAGR